MDYLGGRAGSTRGLVLSLTVFGPCLGALWSQFGTVRHYLVLSWGSFEFILGQFGPSWELFGTILCCLWAVWGNPDSLGTCLGDLLKPSARHVGHRGAMYDPPGSILDLVWAKEVAKMVWVNVTHGLGPQNT